MKFARLSFLPLLTAFLGLSSAACRAAPFDQPLPETVVTATRDGQPAFDLPVSIDRIDRAVIRDGQPQVNLSESLARAAGVVARERQNYAQDLQISIRGFGARSTFGVRGVRLYADGIPATMPDGQGQVSHFDLGSAERIEIMRGPFSALYGNSSGGVIALFTEDGRNGFRLDGDAMAGSDGMWRFGMKASGGQGNLNYIAATTRFHTDGYRLHSAADRDTQNAKLRVSLGEDALLTLVGNAVRMSDVQDPLGLSRAQFAADPRGVDPGALVFDTRKSVDQRQLGLNYERFFGGGDSASLMLYGGARGTVQYQSIPVAAQLAPTSAGGVIDLARRYWGLDLRWTHRATLAGQPLQWTVGASYDRLDERRRGFQNFAGPVLGVQGALRRDEDNRVFNFDQYAQVQWEPSPHWLLMAGARNSMVRVASSDRYIVPGNGDDSGAVVYRATTPVLGATFRLNRDLHLYASYGKGFETPTFNELSYRSVSGAETGLNLGLAAARSDNLEAGVKLRLGQRTRASLAIFHVDTEQELTVLANSGGRSVFQNAGATRRDGIEAGFSGDWRQGSGQIGLRLAWTLMRAVYAQPFCGGACSPASAVAAGNRIPGVPAQSLYGELAWRHAASGFSAALEGRYNGKTYVDDVNSAAAAGYFVASLRAGFEQRGGGWTVKEFIRIDNLADRGYAGSVIVNESNRRFFEPAPGRTWLAGVSISHAW